MSDAEAPDSMGLEVLFDLSPDLMCLATFDGYFRRVNPAFERTLGYTIEELTARPFLDFVHPEDLERTRAVMKVMASGGELREFENRYICRDGSICWLQWNTRVRQAEGLVAAAARDVTDSVARKGQALLRRVATVVAHGGARTDVLNAIAEEVAAFLNADEMLSGISGHWAAPGTIPRSPGAEVSKESRITIECLFSFGESGPTIEVPSGYCHVGQQWIDVGRESTTRKRMWIAPAKLRSARWPN